VSTEARAPGKLFLTGEYAVLGGAPAVVAAVDRHASVVVAPGAAGAALVVDSLAEGRMTRMDVPGDGPLPGGDAGAVMAALRASGAAPAHVTVDSRPFLLGTRKLGLGRSAATLVAATASFLPGCAPQAVLRVALAANALFQDGKGSGADVAASTHGGVVEVRRANGGVSVTARELPAGLHLVTGWTGTPAPTEPLLARFGAAATPGALTELAAIAVAAAAAVARGDAGALCDAVDRSAVALVHLGAELDLPIVTPALARLVRAANRVGAVAKPSGAGAGDCGIALATSPGQAAAVRAAWEEEGIVPLALAVAPQGVSRA